MPTKIKDTANKSWLIKRIHMLHKLQESNPLKILDQNNRCYQEDMRNKNLNNIWMSLDKQPNNELHMQNNQKDSQEIIILIRDQLMENNL